MDDQLWNLFCETGDPVCYLLYAAGQREKKNEKPEKSQPQPERKQPEPKL